MSHHGETALNIENMTVEEDEDVVLENLVDDEIGVMETRTSQETFSTEYEIEVTRRGYLDSSDVVWRSVRPPLRPRRRAWSWDGIQMIICVLWFAISFI